LQRLQRSNGANPPGKGAAALNEPNLSPEAFPVGTLQTWKREAERTAAARRCRLSKLAILSETLSLRELR
jgi:hypothetical protein